MNSTDYECFEYYQIGKLSFLFFPILGHKKPCVNEPIESNYAYGVVYLDVQSTYLLYIRVLRHDT